MRNLADFVADAVDYYAAVIFLKKFSWFWW
jgi:hypothetical protein